MYFNFCIIGIEFVLPSVLAMSRCCWLESLLLVLGIHIETVVAVNCGAILTNQSGWFSPPDPDGDGLYQFKSDCVWVIRARDYKALQIQFTEIDIEEGLMCRYDYVRIFDGNTKVAHFCGTDLPPIITSQAKLFFVEFHSDSFINRRGFNATYTEIDDATCGFLVWRMAGSFGSLDTDVSSVSDCMWTIRETKTTEAIQVYIAKLYQETSDCASFNLEIYNDDFVLGMFCGAGIRRVHTSISTVVYVRLHSQIGIDSDVLVYFCATDEDQTYGGILISASGSFSDVDWDNNGLYDHNANSVWTIVADDDHVIKFDILSLSTEESNGACIYDYLKIYDGVFEPDTELAEFCGRDQPAVTIWTHSSVLYAHWSTDSHSSGQGFDAEYMHVHDAPRNWSISSHTPRTWFPDLSTEETESSTEETGANFVEPVSTTTEAVSRRNGPSSSRNEPSSSTSKPTTIEQGSSSSMVLSNFFTMTVVCILTQYATISKS